MFRVIKRYNFLTGHRTVRIINTFHELRLTHEGIISTVYRSHEEDDGDTLEKGELGLTYIPNGR